MSELNFAQPLLSTVLLGAGVVLGMLGGRLGVLAGRLGVLGGRLVCSWALSGKLIPAVIMANAKNLFILDIPSGQDLRPPDYNRRLLRMTQILRPCSYQAMSNLVAIVGRPNVGKSTLFNRLIGERRAIVGDEPGITRDRIYGQVEWAGTKFSLIDTGGIVPDDDAVIPANILEAGGHGDRRAHVLIWVVDARTGITQLDEELAALFRSTGKNVLVAANKTDSSRLESESTEFYRFGFDEVFPVRRSRESGLVSCWTALSI